MQGIGQLKHVTVWLVLLGFLCGVMGPSVSFAKVYRDIDTEGDPGDGDELVRDGAGGGSDGGLVPPSEPSSIEKSLFHIQLIPVSSNGNIVFKVVIGCGEFPTSNCGRPDELIFKSNTPGFETMV